MGSPHRYCRYCHFLGICWQSGPTIYISCIEWVPVFALLAKHFIKRCCWWFYWICQQAQAGPQQPESNWVQALMWAHFMYCNICTTSSYWPIKHKIRCCTRLPCGPLQCTVSGDSCQPIWPYWPAMQMPWPWQWDWAGPQQPESSCAWCPPMGPFYLL